MAINLDAIKDAMKALGFVVSEAKGVWEAIDTKAHSIYAQFHLGMTAVEADMSLAYHGLLPANHPGRVDDVVNNAINPVVDSVVDSVVDAQPAVVQDVIAQVAVQEQPQLNIGGQGPDKELDVSGSQKLNIGGQGPDKE